MSRKNFLIIMFLVIFTFTMTGCDIFNEDIANNQKIGSTFFVTKVQNLDKLYVNPGTQESGVINKLNTDRNTVDLVLSNGSEVAVEVVWKGANGYYNPEELGIYEFEGAALYNNSSKDIFIEVEVDDRLALTLEIKGEGEILDKEGKIILSSPDKKKEIRYESDSLPLQFTAVPHGSWAFREWRGDYDSENGFSVDITMNDHKQLQAVFGNILVFDVEDNIKTWTDWYIRGKLQNLTGSKIDYVETYVELYDNEDKLITSKVDVIVNISDGEIVGWEVNDKDGYISVPKDSYYEIILRNIQLGD